MPSARVVGSSCIIVAGGIEWIIVSKASNLIIQVFGSESVRKSDGAINEPRGHLM